MASFERRFLTISHQVCLYGGGSTSHHHGNPGNSWYVYFYLWFVVCKFRNVFHCLSAVSYTHLTLPTNREV